MAANLVQDDVKSDNTPAMQKLDIPLRRGSKPALSLKGFNIHDEQLSDDSIYNPSSLNLQSSTNIKAL